MSRRFLDVFLVSFLFDMFMMIIISTMHIFGLNVIGDVVLTLLLVAFVSILIAFNICNFPIDKLSYKLGVTEAGIKYREKLLNVAHDFETETFNLYDEASEDMPKSFEDAYNQLYVYAFANSRDELIRKLMDAFNEIDDFSNDNSAETETK